MLPLHVFIDTSILSAVPRRDSAAFRAIERLCKKGDVVIHLSTVTVREFVSQEEVHLEKALGAARSALKEMQRRGPSSEAALVLAELEQVLAKLDHKLVSTAGVPVEEWIFRLGARIHETQPDAGRQVLDSYFTGGHPFKSRKNRADFPDAFIFESLKELASSESSMHAVIADVQLRESASRLPGVVVYPSLDALITSPDIQALLRNANADQNLAALRGVWMDRRTEADGAIRDQLVGVLAHETFESMHIPDDNQSATVIMVGDAYDITYNTANSEYYGDGCVIVPFEALVEVLAGYSIYKGEWNVLPNRRARRISTSECNDHYVNAEESLRIRARASP